MNTEQENELIQEVLDFWKGKETVGALARDSLGREIHPISPNAVKFCVMGAFLRHDEEYYEAVAWEICKKLDCFSVQKLGVRLTTLNDRGEFAQIHTLAQLFITENSS